jgi:hypothetical protein
VGVDPKQVSANTIPMHPKLIGTSNRSIRENCCINFVKKMFFNITNYVTRLWQHLYEQTLTSLTDEDPGLINQCDFNDWLNERGSLTKIVDCIFHSLISKNDLYFKRKSSHDIETSSSLFVGEVRKLCS